MTIAQINHCTDKDVGAGVVYFLRTKPKGQLCVQNSRPTRLGAVRRSMVAAAAPNIKFDKDAPCLIRIDKTRESP